MAEQITPLSLDQIRAVLAYLPIFEQDDFSFGDWQQFGFTFSASANAFIGTLYEQNFIIQFDWPAWQDEGKQYVTNPQALAEANLLTLRKLLTAHVRSDRFSEGHLAAMYQNGHLTAILRRVRQIYNQFMALQGLGDSQSAGVSVPQKLRGPAEQPPRPDKNCYWLIPGQLLAGEYPGHYTDDAAREKISRFLEAGVTFFVDLTHPHELRPYEQILQQEAARRGLAVEYRRMPVVDMNVPDPQHMADILATIDTAITAGQTVYLHCWGGIGRTGTVVGCYLVRRGMTGDEALNEIARLWQNMAKQNAFPDSPQTKAQIEYVRHWREAQLQPSDRRFDRFRGALLGLAAGDAVGTTLEFKSPGTFTPIEDMVGGGPFQLAPGQWTDDTSMALCLAASLVEKQGFDPHDQMERYVRWWRQGYMSSTGRCFDIGNTVAGALRQFQATGNPMAGSTAPNTAGNGSIMRLAPVPMFYIDQPAQALEQSGESSKTTHGTPMAVDACCYLGGLLVGAINGASKEELLSANYSPVPNYWDTHPLHPKIAAVAAGSFKQKNPPEIKGTGFVVASLEAALWAFYHTDNFREGCLKAVNLGDDADTTGAVYGQIAGAFYGASAIPAAWIEKLALRDTLEDLIDQLYKLGG